MNSGLSSSPSHIGERFKYNAAQEDVESETRKTLEELKQTVCVGDSCKAGDILWVGENITEKTQAEIDEDNDLKNSDATERVLALIKRGGELTYEEMQSLSVPELNKYEQLRWEKEARAEGLELSEETGDDGFKKVLDVKNSLTNTYFDIPKEAKSLYAEFCESGLGKKMQNSEGTEFFGISNVDINNNAFSLAVGYPLGMENGKPVSMRSDFRITKKSSGEFEIATDNSFEAEKTREFFVNGKEVKTPFDSTKYGESDGWNQNFEQDIIFDKQTGIFSANEKYKNLYQQNMGQKSFTSETQEDNEEKVDEIIDPYEQGLKENSPLLQNNNNFYSSYSEGMKYAKAESKNVLVIGVGENCKYCQELYNSVINTEKFMNFINDTNTIVIMKKSEGIYGKVEDWSNTVPTTYFQNAETLNDENRKPKKIVTGAYNMKIYMKKIADNIKW